MLERKKVLPTEAQQVLVVDDNRDSAKTLALVLRIAGHQVEVAFTGPDALEVAQRQQPRVVLLDLAMPGMDGYKVAQALRERAETKDAFIIAISGYGPDEHRERSQAAGINLHLLKPVQNEQLLEILRSVPSTTALRC
jgi:two-component system CheB/CheR fusion protein